MVLAGIVFAAPIYIFLEEPQNNTFTTNSLPDFSFYIIDATEVTANCSLYIDATKEAENDTVLNNTVTVLNPSGSLANGPHKWFVGCGFIPSELRFLTVDQVDPTIEWLSPKKGLIPILPMNSTVTLKIRVNGTFSQWDTLLVDTSNCGGYLPDQSEWNKTKIDETSSDIEIEWNTSDTKFGQCSLIGTVNDSVGYTAIDSVNVFMGNVKPIGGWKIKSFSIRNVDVRPDAPQTTDDLTCHWNASIVFGELRGKDYTTDVTWFNDSVRYTNWDVTNYPCNEDFECSSPTAVPSSSTYENNTWTCQVIGYYNTSTDAKNGTEVIGNWSSIDIGDEPDPVTSGQDILFWVDYENYGGFDINPASCNVTAFSGTKEMNYVLQNSRYESTFTAPGGGTYDWNVSCSAPRLMPQKANSTITVNPIDTGNNGGNRGGRGGDDDETLPDNETPIVRLISPEDESIVETLRPLFKFYVDDDVDETLECLFYLGSFKVQTLAFDVNMSVKANTIGEFGPEIDLDEGIYTWRVSCRDTAGNVAEADSWYFTIELPTNVTDGTNETTRFPLSGAPIVEFFKSPIPWVGILAIALLTLFWLLYKRVTEEEFEEE
jgi:hypothetical protein